MKNLNLFIYNGIILSFFLSIIWILIFNIWNYYFLDFNYKKGLLWVSFLLLLNPIYFIEYFFSSKNKIRYNSIIRTISYVICFFLKLIGISYNFKIDFFIKIILLEVFLTSILFIIILPKKSKLLINNNRIDFKIQYKILKNSFLIFLYALGVNLFSRIDILMIQKYLSLEDLGNYTASFKIVSFFYAFPLIIANSFYPKILKIKDNDQILSKMYFISFWSSSFLFLFIYILRGDIINLLFGDQFNYVKEIFSISCLPIIIMGLSSTFVKVMYKHSLQRYLFFRSIFGIILNVLLNLYFIPKIGIKGVAYATVISIFFVEIFYDFFNEKTRLHHITKLKAIFIKPF